MGNENNLQALESTETTDETNYAMCNPKLLDDNYAFVKENLKNILHSQTFCCICLKVDKPWYYELDFTYSKADPVDKIENIIMEVFGDILTNCLLTKSICQSCIKEITNIHRYITKVRNTTKIITSYIDQMNTELDTIHSIQQSNVDTEFANTVIHLHKNIYAVPLDRSCPDCNEVPCVHSDYLSIYAGGNTKTKCIECSQSYNTKEALVVHVNQAHLGHYPFHCNACGQAFPSTHQRQCHQLTCGNHSYKCIEEDELWGLEQCKVCRKMFCSATALSLHAKSHGKAIAAPFARECSICQEKLFSLDSLNQHMNSHEYGDRHHCTVCDKDFESRKCYKAHCNSWPHQRRANPHKKFHHQCALCTFSCPSLDSMENHTNVYHLKIKPHGCGQCDATFTSRTHLKHHLARHEGTKLRKYQCYHCPFILTTLSGLKRHLMRIHNDGIRPYECQYCIKRYVSRNELQTHIASRHSTEKSHKCPLCSRTFGTLPATRCHVRKSHVKTMDLKEFLKEVRNDSLDDLFRDRRRAYVVQ